MGNQIRPEEMGLALCVNHSLGCASRDSYSHPLVDGVRGHLIDKLLSSIYHLRWGGVEEVE